MILITGATGGLGYEFAKKYASMSKALLLVGRNEERLKNIKFELTDQYNVNIDIVVSDFAKDFGVEDLIKYIKDKNYVIETIINNAGFTDKYDFCDSVSKYDILNVNLLAVQKLMDFGLKHNNTIKILNVSSIAGVIPTPGIATYSASKGYIKSISQAVNYELKKSKSKAIVSTLVVGAIRTGFFDSADIKAPFVEKYLSMEAIDVATKTINEFEAGSSFIVPGFINKITYIVYKVLPSQVFYNLNYKIFK